MRKALGNAWPGILVAAWGCATPIMSVDSGTAASDTGGVDAPASDTGGVDAATDRDAGGVTLGSCQPLPTESCSADQWCSSTLLLGSIFAVHAAALDDVWLGSNGVAHFDGTHVCTLAPWPDSGRIRAIHGTATDDVWFVGDDSLIAHWDGHTLRVDVGPVTSGGTHWSGVWASSRSDAWAVGEGSIAHWDGSSWTTSAAPSGSTGSLAAVRGIDATHVFAVTNDATGAAPLDGDILAWDGSSWTVAYTGDGTVTFAAILPISATSAYAIGNSALTGGVGRVFIGPASWTEDTATSWTAHLNAAAVDPSGTVRLFGTDGAIVAHGASGWVAETSGLESGGSGPAIFGASSAGTTVYAGGHGGVFVRRAF